MMQETRNSRRGGGHGMEADDDSVYANEQVRHARLSDLCEHSQSGSI